MIYTESQITQAKYVAVRAMLLAVVAAMSIGLVAPVMAHAVPRRLTNQDRTVTSTEVKQALQNTDGVLQTSSQTKAGSDADSALVTATAGATVDVPRDARRGVQLAGKDGASLSVGLPNASSAGVATRVANGVVGYPSATGSANAVQTNADGSVRMLTVIDNPSAPTRYDYTVSLPPGGRIQVMKDGAAIILDANGRLVSIVDKPWAKDASGNEVKTWYTSNGSSLIQHIRHAAGHAYPVAADPRFSWGWSGVTLYLTKSETRYVSGVSFAAAAAFLGLTGWPGAGVAAVGYTADYAIQNGKYCLAVYRPYSYWTVGYSWLYKC